MGRRSSLLELFVRVKTRMGLERLKLKNLDFEVASNQLKIGQMVAYR